MERVSGAHPVHGKTESQGEPRKGNCGLCGVVTSPRAIRTRFAVTHARQILTLTQALTHTHTRSERESDDKYCVQKSIRFHNKNSTMSIEKSATGNEEGYDTPYASYGTQTDKQTKEKKLRRAAKEA